MKRLLAVLLLLSACGLAQTACVNCGGGVAAITDNGTNVISTEGFLAPIGTTTVPAYSFTGNTNFGLNFINGQNEMVFDIGGNYRFGIVNSEIRAGATSCFTFSSNNDPTATNSDIALCRDAAVGTLAVKAGPSATADMKFRVYGTNGGFVEYGASSELLTIAAAATTDTTGSLLPANSIIDAVDVRVTTVIPTAATFTVGDATIAARFATGVSTAAATTAVGDLQADQTGTSGPRQVASAKVRITPNLTPGTATGVVRITVHYHSFTPPTS